MNRNQYQNPNESFSALSQGLGYPLRLAIVLTLFLCMGLISACASQPDVSEGVTSSPVASTPVSTPVEPIATALNPESSVLGGNRGVPEEVVEMSTAVAARTPIPTPIPGPIEQEVAKIAADLGVSGKTFLGLTIEDWIDVVIWTLIVVIGYFLGVKLLTLILTWIVKRTNTELDNTLVEQMEPDLNWLVFLFLTHHASLRLDFLSDSFRKTLADIFFTLFLVTFTVIGLRLIKYGAAWYKDSLESDEERFRLSPVISAVRRVLALFLLIFMTSVGLAHFGIDLGVLSIGILVLAGIFSLGAKDTISDAISGFVILIDQPFRINDGLQVRDLNTWGDVSRIGLRTTQIITRDNLEVIIPNTRILNSQLVNFTFPDPTFRMEVDLRIAYWSDLEKARAMIADAVRNVDGVLPDKNVDVLLVDFGDTAREIRARWWIADYHLQYPMRDRVCTAIDAALKEGGIDIPITTYDLNVRMKDGYPTPQTQLNSKVQNET